MTRGRHSAVLSADDRRRLRKFRAARERVLRVFIGIPELRRSMDAPFSWETLQRALTGKPISLRNYDFIVKFLDRFEAQGTFPYTDSNGGHGQGRGGGNFSQEEATRRGSR
jgi:hypothetical protein